MEKDGESLPNGYKEGITRVSELVSFIHPFDGTDGQKRYLDWLKGHGIEEKIYIESAQIMGTYIHETLEHYILKGKKKKISKDFADCSKEIEWGIKWLKELDYQEIETEKYVREKDERFQGSVDLLYKKNDEWVLADWKSYGICKKRFGLENKFTVATGKKNKVLLQMSFYCYALRQQGIDVTKIQLLFLHEKGIKVVEMECLPDKDIEDIMEKWEVKKYLF